MQRIDISGSYGGGRMDSYLYYCTNCKKLFKVGGMGKKVKCSQCSGILSDLKVTSEEYGTLSSAEKESIKARAKSAAVPVEVQEPKSVVEPVAKPKPKVMPAPVQQPASPSIEQSDPSSASSVPDNTASKDAPKKSAYSSFFDMDDIPDKSDQTSYINNNNRDDSLKQNDVVEKTPVPKTERKGGNGAKKAVIIICAALLACIIGVLIFLFVIPIFSSKPDKAVKQFCDGMKTFDLEKMAEVVSTMDNVNNASKDEEEYQVIWNYVTESASKMSYEIISSEKDGDKGSVTVKFNHVDAAPLIASTFSDFITKAIGLAFTGADDSVYQSTLEGIFNEKRASMTEPMVDTTATFSCSKTDDGWKIDKVPDEVVSVLLCNMDKAFDKLNSDDDSVSQDPRSDDDNSSEEESTEWHDIHIGETVEFNTLKITVKGCEELTTLSDEYDSVDADEGTKFVVFTVELENITKDPITFDSGDIPFFDNQDRQFSDYDEAYMYFDETFNYESLEPNMKKIGNFVYNVPEDATGYYFACLKDGTNEGYKFYGE